MSGFLGMFVGGAAAPGPVTIGAVTILSSTSVSVAFTPPTSDGGSPILDYTVTSSPGSITATGASSPITVTGLTPGITYTFSVTARNAVGGGLSSSPSSSVQVWSVPDAPTSVSATAGNGQATVSFSAPSYNGGKAILDYRVTSSPGGITATGSGSPITITGLSNGTAYTFTVQARNEIGYSSASSPSNSVTPVVPPVSASGGNYIYDGTGSFAGYRFHVFLSPGTFRVSSNDGNKSFASVIVGGGGSGLGGGGGVGGGGGGGVSDVTGLTLTPDTDYPVSVGYGGFGGGSPAGGPSGNRLYNSTGSGWYGGSAGGGESRETGRDGGSSGNGYGGGTPAPSQSNTPKGGSGGGGAGGNGSNGGTRSGPPATYGDGSPVPPSIIPYAYGGPGGIGYRSSIDGNTYGGGGGGGRSALDSGFPAPIGYGGAGGGGPGTPDGRPNGGAGNGGYNPNGNDGGDGASGTGGGGGGGGPGIPNVSPYYPGTYNGASGPPAGIGKARSEGGPGVVVIRYPYP